MEGIVSGLGLHKGRLARPLDSLPIGGLKGGVPTGRSLLKKYLDETGRPPSVLAKEVGVHDTFLARVLAGERRPGLDTALRLQELLGIPVEAWAKKGSRKAT